MVLEEPGNLPHSCVEEPDPPNLAIKLPVMRTIAAPTGLAAFNVGGMTIHRLFHLPIEHEGRQAGYWSLSKTSQKVMKSTLRSLKLVIVDEVSMVSSLNLAYMHLRLEELFCGHDWFGIKSIVMFR